eukprot:2678169-Pleurochrysis_carterae.AAC.1
MPQRALIALCDIADGRVDGLGAEPHCRVVRRRRAKPASAIAGARRGRSPARPTGRTPALRLLPAPVHPRLR